MRSLFVLLVTVLSGSVTAIADYPDRPIKMIVPWAAGGDTDNIFRPFAPLLQKHLGGTVVIANVGGASGTKRRAGGERFSGRRLYALRGARLHPFDLLHGVTDINHWDFEPVCLISATPSVLTASPKNPWKD